MTLLVSVGCNLHKNAITHVRLPRHCTFICNLAYKNTLMCRIRDALICKVNTVVLLVRRKRAHFTQIIVVKAVITIPVMTTMRTVKTESIIAGISKNPVFFTTLCCVRNTQNADFCRDALRHFLSSPLYGVGHN